ncbi:tRNA dihydrouridine synthase DusB [Aurantimonas endophytica]|uniref:tRNA-dihydrouridine synthase n=1 Tax=Aurantimonas endophytica TaxID=1522175 RepID=A0A7W6HA95_9HYPH|nr:tRNA dihydrouridine synthase DusB [Aurantimonas endophytica]MBB4001510.1 nifR3 family TIM-barrel protein [Aurantimonas endophytica]MCO6402849.1 tRNA dihydrouridine synthase DusB [Aurantimonas endophytica]
MPDLRDPLTIGEARLRNRVLLAPLSGISDVPFRRLARRFGAGMVVSEMGASGELVKGDQESAMRAMRDGPGLHVVQLAGRDPAWMSQAAEQLSEAGADIIDINMGCPAKKVVGGLSGSALMREPDLALRIVEATVAGAGSVPVTLKMRLGWDRSTMNAPVLAARAEAAGVQAIVVHGRTRSEFYEGRADWPAIGAVRAVVGVPVIANGDVTLPEDLAPMLAASRADAVMVGRGSQGRPWLPGMLAGAIGETGLRALYLADLVEEHYEAMLSHYGAEAGLRRARKHLGWYLDRFAAAATVAPSDRAAILGGSDTSAIRLRLRHLIGTTQISEVEPAFRRRPLQRAA